MSVSTLMSELRTLEVRLWVDGDHLRCDAPTGVLTPMLRQQLAQYKSEILQFLQSAAAFAKEQRGIVPLQGSGTQVPVFAVGGHNGDVFTYRTLVDLLGADQPFFGLQPPGIDGGEPLRSVDELAAYFADQISAFLPSGPFMIAGFCVGSTVAFATACELRRRGRNPQRLVMFAPCFPSAMRFLPAVLWSRRVKFHINALVRTKPWSWPKYFVDMHARAKAQPASGPVERENDATIELRERLEQITIAAVKKYQPRRYDGPVTLMIPSPEWVDAGVKPLLWRTRVPAGTTEYYGNVGTTMEVMLRGPDTPTFARYFREIVDADRAQRTARNES